MNKEKLITIIALVVIVGLGAFFRFYEITEIPLGLYPDEAMNGSNAMEALETGQFKVFYPENNGREGLFINIQALSIKIFGNEPWALRVVSALVGTLTILAVYLLAKELFKNQAVALLSSFFLATSFWHINFSRIGFRAIMVPLLASCGTYFFLKGLRDGKIWNMVFAGVFIGLGFHTYIAFRFVPFVLVVPIIWYLWKWWKENQKICHPCLTILFMFVTFVTALPIGYYFLQNPQDFFGRSGQVSIFSAESPLTEFAKSNISTMGMFFIKGDCNWRHNFNCQPELYWLVAIFFAVGILVALKNFKSLPHLTMLAWLFFLSLPATLTREGLPHALRSIGMIPPIMILAGLGAWKIWEVTKDLLEAQRQKRPTYVGQLSRIQKEIVILGLLFLLVIPLVTFRTYFVYWAHNPNTYFAFATDLLHLGQFLDKLPDDTRKYVVVNLPGTEVRDIPMPAQTVMFATDTFKEEKRQKKNMTYLLPATVQHRVLDIEGKTVIALLNGSDRELLKTLRQKFPQFKVSAPGDFIILEN